MNRPAILISAFGDEAANRKTAIEQLTTLAGIGLNWYSPRFVDVAGSGTVEHVVDLTDDQYAQLRELHDEYAMQVTSIGARVGKIKLLDVDDGSHNAFVPLAEYLETEVARTIHAARQLGTRLVRGFSFYHPRGTRPEEHLDTAVEAIRAIVEACAAEDLVYGLEIEPNLVGETGSMLSRLVEGVNHPNIVAIFDGGNVAAQNKHAVQCYQEYLECRDQLGWMHIKDYRIDPDLVWEGAVDEDRLKNFVPADAGDSGHEMILRDLRDQLPALTQRMQQLGIPGFFLETEPHLKGGGQFGGFSGPDGMGVAVRRLCALLDYVGIRYDLRSFADIRARRGF